MLTAWGAVLGRKEFFNPNDRRVRSTETGSTLRSNSRAWLGVAHRCISPRGGRYVWQVSRFGDALQIVGMENR
jgi:hypothetical protein